MISKLDDSKQTAEAKMDDYLSPIDDQAESRRDL